MSHSSATATKNQGPDLFGGQHTPPPSGTVYWPEDLAAQHDFKPEVANGKTEWHGANPKGGATDDGGILNDDGTFYDRKLKRRYKSHETAELFGISPDQYGPCVEYRAKNSPKTRQSAEAPTEAPQPVKSPEARGITPQTLGFFGVKRINGSAPNRNGWNYPTHHADGTKGRTRFKNARQKSKVESKYKWWDGGDGREPDAYNLQNIPDDAPEVWAVGGEPDVWTMHQNGFLAVAAFGETSGAARLVSALVEKRAECLNIALDNDAAGREGAFALVEECERQGLAFTVREFRGADGHDVCDEFTRTECDRERFRAAILALSKVDRATVESWKEAPAEAPSAEPATEAKPAASRFPRLKLREIFARPRLEYLVDGFFIERGTGVVSADYGAFKSFLALDLGLCVATGKAWQGRAVKRGTVVYIVAEGAYETEARAKAWLIKNGGEVPENFEIIETGVQISEPTERAAFIGELRELSPALVILDTLAKCNLGKDENGTAEMGLFTNGMEVIARELGAFVLAIHHNNKEGKMRGNVSLPANVDASIILKRAPNRIVTVECDRVKGAPFEPFSLIGRVVELPETDEHGRPLTSLVFEPTDAPAETVPKADQTREMVFQALKSAPKGLAATEWQKKTGLSPSRFYDHRDALTKSGRVTQNGRIYQVTPITPITPNQSEKEPIFYSDYSDDSLESEQSEHLAGATKRSSLFGENEPSAKPKKKDQHEPPENLYGQI